MLTQPFPEAATPAASLFSQRFRLRGEDKTVRNKMGSPAGFPAETNRRRRIVTTLHRICPNTNSLVISPPLVKGEKMCYSESRHSNAVVWVVRHLHRGVGCVATPRPAIICPVFSL